MPQGGVRKGGNGTARLGMPVQKSKKTIQKKGTPHKPIRVATFLCIMATHALEGPFWDEMMQTERTNPSSRRLEAARPKHRRLASLPFPSLPSTWEIRPVLVDRT